MADVILERMVVKLIGDASSYKKMWKDSVTVAKSAAAQIKKAQAGIGVSSKSVKMGQAANNQQASLQAQHQSKIAQLALNHQSKMVAMTAQHQQAAAAASAAHASKQSLQQSRLQARQLNDRTRFHSQWALQDARFRDRTQRESQKNAEWDRRQQAVAAERASRAARGGSGNVFSRVGNVTKNLGSNMRNVGIAGSLAVTAPVLSIGKMAVSEALSWEKSWTKILALTNMGEKDIEDMKKQVEGLAVATGVGPIALVNALYPLSSAGLTAKQAMEALEVSAKASASGLGDINSIADFASSAIGAYGSQNMNATKAVDILVAAVREGKGEVQDYADVMGRVMPIAQQMGIGLDQVAGSIASMSLGGIKPDEGATALRGILSQIISPDKGSEKFLKQFSLNGQEMTFEMLRKSIKEKGLIVALDELYNVLGRNHVAASELFPEIRGLIGFFDLMGPKLATTNKIMEATARAAGSTDAAFSKTAATSGHALAVMQAKFDLMLISLGQKLIPMVLKVSEAVEKGIEAWNKLSPAVQDNIVQWGLFAAILFPVIAVVGSVLSVVGSLFTIMGIAGPLAMTLLAGSLGPVVVALMAAAAAAGYLAYMFHSANAEADKARAKTEKMGEAQLEQIRGMAGPDQQEALEREIKRREGAVIQAQNMRDAEETRIREENIVAQGMRGTVKMLGVDSLKPLNADVESAQKDLEKAQAMRGILANQPQAPAMPDMTALGMVLGGKPGSNNTEQMAALMGILSGGKTDSVPTIQGGGSPKSNDNDSKNIEKTSQGIFELIRLSQKQADKTPVVLTEGGL